MKIVEIKNTPDGEVAYIFDERAGKLYKIWVEDYTQTEEEERPLPKPKPKQRIRPVEMPIFDGKRELTVDDIPDDLPDRRPPARTIENENTQEELPPSLRVTPKRNKSMIPPHLVGIFRKPGEPGAAIETRNV